MAGSYSTCYCLIAVSMSWYATQGLAGCVGEDAVDPAEPPPKMTALKQ